MVFYYPNRLRVQIDCGDEIITKQANKDECDINTILKQYQKTGIITHINNAQSTFTDLPPQMDYQEALALVQSSVEAFAELPSVVRDRYNNDPSSFLSALYDPEQHDYLREVGILKPKPKPAEPAPEPAP